jgi:hypothetical protein
LWTSGFEPEVGVLFALLHGFEPEIRVLFELLHGLNRKYGFCSNFLMDLTRNTCFVLTSSWVWTGSAGFFKLPYGLEPEIRVLFELPLGFEPEIRVLFEHHEFEPEIRVLFELPHGFETGSGVEWILSHLEEGLEPVCKLGPVPRTTVPEADQRRHHVLGVWPFQIKN